MITSMTGFASAKGERGRYSWGWELRSVNAKGLDLRLRVPDWLDGLEAALRAELAKAVARGNVTLSLRLVRSDAAAGSAVNEEVLAAALEALARIEAEAMARGVTLAPSKASDLLGLRGMMDAAPGEEDNAALIAQLRAELAPLIDAFLAMRRAEGRALEQVLRGQLEQVGRLVGRAAELAEARKPAVAETLRGNLRRILDNAEGADPDRVAQELAMLAVKADVTEELDRLRTHVGAAVELLDAGGAAGRKLDFLMQEFNREANTLCSKSQNAELTKVGLELKAVIDQMREQVQNVE